jgi:hypothetical protein
MLVAQGGGELCVDDADAIVCYKPDDSTPPKLEPRLRLVGGGDVTRVATAYGSACVLAQGAVACAPRAKSGADHAVEELRLARVGALASTTELWGTPFSFLALDGGRVFTWDDRGAPAPVVWSALGPDEQVYDDAGDWYLYRGGQLLRRPDRPWPLRFDVDAKPTQLSGTWMLTCALVSGHVVCFE